MEKTFVHVAWDCFVDLSVTIVYATIAGLLIVGVVATDDGMTSLIRSALYASLLPLSVIGLIGVDAALRVASERRALRRRTTRGHDLAYGFSRF